MDDTLAGGIEMKLNVALLLSALSAVSLIVACGDSSSVEGSTYEDSTGGMSIEFKSGGKANAAIGPASGACTYVQKDKKITLDCEGTKMELTMNDDGSLAAQGLPAKLTKKKT